MSSASEFQKPASTTTDDYLRIIRGLLSAYESLISGWQRLDSVEIEAVIEARQLMRSEK